MFVDHMHQPWRTLEAINFVIIGEDYQEYGLSIPDVMLTDVIKQSVKKKTDSRRVVKKKVTLFADDNTISDDPDAALELAKSISRTDAKEEEATKKVHDTHARIVTESAKKKSDDRSSRSVAIQDITSTPKSTPATLKSKLKVPQSLNPAEQEASDIMQALKESKKSSKRQPSTEGSSEGTGSIPKVPKESTIISTTSSEGNGAKPGVPDEDKDITEEKVILGWGDEEDETDDVEKDDKDGDADDEGDDHVSDTQDADDEDVKTESDEDDIYKYKIRVRKDEDEEIKDTEVEVSDKAKEGAETTSEAKDDTKKTELPPSSLSLSVSSGFGDQFLKLSSDSSLVEGSSIHDSRNNKSSTYTRNPIVQQTTTPIPTPPITTNAPTVTTIVSGSNTLIDVQLRVAKLEQDVFELKNVDHSSEVLAILELHVPAVVDSYLDSKVGDIIEKPTPTTEQESEKSPPKILKIKKEQAEKQKTPKFTIKSTNKATLEEYDLKSALYQSMHANKSLNRNPANYKLYHALMEALIKDENAMDKGVANTVKDYKRKHDDDDDDDDEGPSARLNQGSKTGKFASAQEPVEEPIDEVVMDEAGEDVPHDDDQPQDTSDPKTRKMVSATKDPLTFNDLMDTPIDFSKYGPIGHRTVAAEYFFNNYLEYLKTSDPKVSKFSKHNVYSTKAIIGVKSVSVKKLHRYGHLEEIVVKRSDQQLYKFKEGDFVDLHLNDIEDMLFLVVQHKLFHLEGSDIIDFIMSLRMFTRSLILKRRVQDLQLDVESYQKKLNIIAPQKTYPDIKCKEPSTPSYDPTGIVYEDLN
ncbi:hypothetical protein Tco_0529526 [Tanacetum coccineum]